MRLGRLPGALRVLRSDRKSDPVAIDTGALIDFARTQALYTVGAAVIVEFHDREFQFEFADSAAAAVAFDQATGLAR